jgi:hypothetical protein
MEKSGEEEGRLGKGERRVEECEMNKAGDEERRGWRSLSWRRQWHGSEEDGEGCNPLVYKVVVSGKGKLGQTGSSFFDLVDGFSQDGCIEEYNGRSLLGISSQTDCIIWLQ